MNGPTEETGLLSVQRDGGWASSQARNCDRPITHIVAFPCRTSMGSVGGSVPTQRMGVTQRTPNRCFIQTALLIVCPRSTGRYLPLLVSMTNAPFGPLR